MTQLKYLEILNLNLIKKLLIKHYLKDHRVFMTSVIAALIIWWYHGKFMIKTLLKLLFQIF